MFTQSVVLNYTILARSSGIAIGQIDVTFLAHAKASMLQSRNLAKKILRTQQNLPIQQPDYFWYSRDKEHRKTLLKTD